jgi:Mg-chelatase subunit ChlD
MIFFQPIWFLLIIPLTVLLVFWKPSNRTLLVLRILFWTMIILAMADTALRLSQKNGTVVVIADRSLSMPANSCKQEEEAVRIIKQSQTFNDRLAVISFAEKATIEKLPGNKQFDGLKSFFTGDRSSLTQALQTAESLIPDGSSGRILLLSDGRWTGSSPDIVFAKLAGRGIPVDYRILRRSAFNDLAVSKVEAPHSVAPKEYFPVRAVLQAPKVGTVLYQVVRNNKIIFKGRRKVKPGVNRLFFRDKSNLSQVLRYNISVKYEKSTETVLENNNANFLVKVTGEQPILLVTLSLKSTLAKVLRNAGIKLIVKRPAQCSFGLAELGGYSAIILENIPAQKLGKIAMDNIAEWVKNTGSGLMITGGRNSYGLGGYYHSPLDKIMPVSMELKKEHRKFSLAIVVILDRSGSMSMPASAGKTKMDLANLATAEVFNMLNDRDELGVIAVDSSPHTIIPINEKANLGGAYDKIMRIASQGGGIFVYTGMVAGLKMLVKAKAGTKHIVLFADAADAEEPGRYKELLAKCLKSGITVSVMALGRESDSDAKFLEDVAKRGNGQIYFTENASELPRLFAQDTFVIARNSFVEENTQVKLTAGMHMLSSDNFGGKFSFGGFNLCFLKPGAEVGAITKDENSAPVVAFHQVGTGRVLCYTGETDGVYTGAFANWSHAGNFLGSLARWTSGSKNANNVGDSMLFTQTLQNGVHRITLHLDPDRKVDPFKKLPALLSMTSRHGMPPKLSKLKMRWEDSDTLVCETPLDSTQTNLTTAHVEGFKPKMLAPVKLMYSPEFEPAKTLDRKYSIPRLSSLTGGKERANLESIWQDMPVTVRTRPIAKWLVLAALIILLLEVLEHRTGIISMIFVNNTVKSKERIKSKSSGKASIKATEKPVKRRRKIKKAGTEKENKASEVEEKIQEMPENNDMSNAFRRAKGKTKR